MSRKEVYTLGKRIFLITLTIVFVFAGVFIYSLFTDLAKVSALGDMRQYKYYTSIMVQQGDSLWSIADVYITSEYHDKDDYINEVKKLNHLNSNDIHAGEYLMIPYYSAEYL